jgi:hypothetical protein
MRGLRRPAITRPGRRKARWSLVHGWTRPPRRGKHHLDRQPGAGHYLDPDDRAFSSILKAKTTILGSVLNVQVRVDDRRFAGATSAHDIEMENIISERLEAAKRQIERMR